MMGRLRIRRGTASLVAMAIATAGCGAAAAPQATQEPQPPPHVWMPTYKGNAGRTGEVDAIEPPAQPGIQWTVQLDGETKSSPVIVDTRAYLVGTDAHVIALDVAGRDVAWSSPDGGYQGNLATDGSVLVACGEDGRVAALSLVDGAERWRRDVAAGGSCSPLIVGDWS